VVTFGQTIKIEYNKTSFLESNFQLQNTIMVFQLPFTNYLVVSKFYMGWIRDVLHQRIITIEQVPLDCHRGEGRVVKLFRQPETKQDGIQ